MTEKTPVFPFDTGFYSKPDPYTHFTVRGDGEVVEANEKHESSPGPASLQMDIWAEDPEAAIMVYRKISEHIGFKSAGDIAVETSTAMSPPSSRPSAYNVKFIPAGETEKT